MEWNFEHLTAAQLATAVSLPVPPGAQVCIVQANGGTVRARWGNEGTPPTATVGHELQDGVEFTLPDPEAIANAQFILSSGSPSLDAHFGISVED